MSFASIPEVIHRHDCDGEEGISSVTGSRSPPKSERVGFDDESKTLADVMAIARRQQTQQNDQVRSKIIRRRYLGS